MRKRRLLISMILVMSVLTLTGPLIPMKPSAADVMFDIGHRTLAGKAELADAENTIFAKPTVPGPLTQISETDKPQFSAGRIDPRLLNALGLMRSAKGSGNATRQRMKDQSKLNKDSQMRPQSGQPQVLDERSALSAALITSIGGRDNQFSEVTLLADWDGREDCVADRELKVGDASNSEIEIDETTTRVAISEHTIANGFNESLTIRGNSLGCLRICGRIFGQEICLRICIPTLVSTGESGGALLLNRIPGDCADDQVTITGIAVNPVADLGDFGLCNTIGEVIYVSSLDTEGCSSNAANQPFRTRIFAFGFMDAPGGVVPVGAIQLLRSPLSNVAGLAVDDDGNLYFQLVDLINLQNGGAIFKVTETPRAVVGCGSGPRINRVISSIPNGLTGDIGLGTAVGSTANPALTSGGFRLTNYSGQSTTFGNIVSLASGQSNVLYAAVARSFNPADNVATQATEGAFANAPALGPTPSMIISFADCSGGFDSCSSPAPGRPGNLPVADGFADVARSGLTRVPGANNFRIFALGNGPDIRPLPSGTAIIPGTPSSVLKLDMQIDFTIHSGIAVNEEGTVFVISGGTPAGIGTNPSPLLGEILCFEDRCPMDRRADFIDFRGDVLPNPPDSGDNIGDGDSDRFDHIFHQAPLDQVTLTPAGLAGLARGFLRYTNRLAPNPISPGITLGVIGGQTVQGDDETSGPIIFENLDPGHQVAGGDDQNPPFTGDDSDGVANPNTANNPALAGPLSGGFEFLFGAAGVPGSTTTPCINNVWNAFFLNSNGNITFNGGDTDGTPTVPEFRSGLSKIAPAWADLNPDARAINPINFPAQALGFASVNAFKVRWLNVPEFEREGCSTNAFGIGGNTFSVRLYDDGLGFDENVQLTASRRTASQCLLKDIQGCLFRNDDSSLSMDLRCSFLLELCQVEPGGGVILEGPTTFVYSREPNTQRIIPCPRRREETGHFAFDYARMELLGTPERPVITGYSEGGASPLNPPGLCETNLGLAASRADTSPFGVIDGQTASIEACLIGQGTEPHIFELFNEGRDASIGAGGEITFATPDFDLRFEGNDPALCAPARQRDLNRDKVGFFGKTCPIDPIPLLVTPTGPVPVAPGQPAVGSANAGSLTDSSGNRGAMPTSGIINALCDVQLNILGCGFFPNETTTICQGFSAQTGVPLQRPGKTVTSSAAIACDTNGDGITDATVSLANVTPINRSLVRVTLPRLSAIGLPGTVFPLSCCGGLANLTLTTTFTPGDNNQFGAFTRTAALPIDLGVRAPVVLSATPASGDCLIAQDLLISGACFIGSGGAANVTSVFAVERGNPNNVAQASRFVVLNANLIDAFFNFGTANAGKTFLIFASGPSGTSQNLTSPPVGAGCPAGLLGNQQGIRVAFTCDPITTQSGLAVVSDCKLDRNPSGGFELIVTGTNIKERATVTVGGVSPRKVKFKDKQTGTNSFNRLILRGRFCNGLPGVILITNPGPDGGPSKPFNCAEKCQ